MDFTASGIRRARQGQRRRDQRSRRRLPCKVPEPAGIVLSGQPRPLDGSVRNIADECRLQNENA